MSKYKTTLDEVLAFRRWMYEESRHIVSKKGHDYNRTQQENGDTLFNLRVCELLGIVDTAEQGILVRLSDKFMRLASLTAPGVEPANRDESVMDTIVDIHNYVDYLGLIWHQRTESERATALDPGSVTKQPSPADIGDAARSPTAASSDYWRAPVLDGGSSD